MNFSIEMGLRRGSIHSKGSSYPGDFDSTTSTGVDFRGRYSFHPYHWLRILPQISMLFEFRQSDRYLEASSWGFGAPGLGAAFDAHWEIISDTFDVFGRVQPTLRLWYFTSGSEARPPYADLQATTHSNRGSFDLFVGAGGQINPVEASVGLVIPCAWTYDSGWPSDSCNLFWAANIAYYFPPSDPSTAAPGGGLCGNNIRENLEECDTGPLNANLPDRCRLSCEEPECGDWIMDPGEGEECDDGNTNDGDGCDSDCEREAVVARCGDGSVNQPAEQCDDGNNTVGDSCDADCQNEPVCGNGVRESSEECDDHNNINLDGCDDRCHIELPEALTNPSLHFTAGGWTAPTGPVEQHNFMSIVRTLAYHIDEMTRRLPSTYTMKITVEGHTDNKPMPGIGNMELSERRAQTVANLVSSELGSRYPTTMARLVGGQLSAEGYGETQPLASNNTATGRAQNRRIQIRVDFIQ